MNNTDKIIFISTWIQQKFYSGLKNVDISKSDIVQHGISKIQNINLKAKKILFVGKLNKAKGYDIFCKAALMFRKYNLGGIYSDRWWIKKIFFQRII